MSLQLFGRSWSLTIGPPGGLGRMWASADMTPGVNAELRITFDVQRGKKNTSRVQLFNLDPISRGIVSTTGAYVTLLAGYGGMPGLIFRGDVSRRGVKVERQGPDRVVTLECGDGELAWREARFDRSFAPGTPNTVILTQILATMTLGIGPGDPLPPVVYGSGVTFFGPARDALTRIAADAGCEVSIQDGLAVFLLPGSATKDGAAFLSSGTGLVGAPTPTKNGVNAKSLLNPQIRPGRFVQLASETFNGWFKAVNVKHAGDSHGGEWTTTLEAVPVKVNP